MSRIQNGISASNRRKEVERPPLTVTSNHQSTIAQPSNFDIERVVSIGHMQADKLLAQVQRLVKKAGCEVEIINDIQLVEQPDGTRTVVIKRTTRLQKDPA